VFSQNRLKLFNTNKLNFYLNITQRNVVKVISYSHTLLIYKIRTMLTHPNNCNLVKCMVFRSSDVIVVSEQTNWCMLRSQS